MLIKKIERLESIPKGYGVAWIEAYNMYTYVMPIPFNIIARLIRSFYFSLVQGLYKSKLEIREMEAYSKGREEGIKSIEKIIQCGFHKDFILRDGNDKDK